MQCYYDQNGEATCRCHEKIQVRVGRNSQQIAVTLGSPEPDVAALHTELREIGYEAVPA